MTTSPATPREDNEIPCPVCGAVRWNRGVRQPTSGLLASSPSEIRERVGTYIKNSERAPVLLTVDGEPTVLQPGQELHISHEFVPSATREMKPGRRVVCAAVRAADGALLLGIRHYSADMHLQLAERYDGPKFSHRHDEDQGFVDQHGVFMSREEAYRVAEAAGQIIRPTACGEGLAGPKLYSEGLY